MFESEKIKNLAKSKFIKIIMRYSQFFVPTTKEIPNDAEIISHQLMIRAGYIQRVASGIYTYLPLGLRVLNKFQTIIREEMNRSNAIEVLMPSVIPESLWKQSGRWDLYGDQLLKLEDRSGRGTALGPLMKKLLLN